MFGLRIIYKKPVPMLASNISIATEVAEQSCIMFIALAGIFGKQSFCGFDAGRKREFPLPLA